MPIDFHYFISTLPMLKRGETPLISHSQLLDNCRSLLASSDAEAIAALSLDVTGEPCVSPLETARQWHDFETLLRNTAAALRGARLHRTDVPQKPTDFISQYIKQRIEEAFALPSPAERETVLDTLRWQFLDSLEHEHPCDLDTVAIYALKLLLLERIASRKLDDGMKAYKQLIADGVQQAEAARQNH